MIFNWHEGIYGADPLLSKYKLIDKRLGRGSALGSRGNPNGPVMVRQKSDHHGKCPENLAAPSPAVLRASAVRPHSDFSSTCGRAAEPRPSLSSDPLKNAKSQVRRCGA